MCVERPNYLVCYESSDTVDSDVPLSLGSRLQVRWSDLQRRVFILLIDVFYRTEPRCYNSGISRSRYPRNVFKVCVWIDGVCKVLSNSVDPVCRVQILVECIVEPGHCFGRERTSGWTLSVRKDHEVFTPIHRKFRVSPSDPQYK